MIPCADIPKNALRALCPATTLLSVHVLTTAYYFAAFISATTMQTPTPLVVTCDHLQVLCNAHYRAPNKDLHRRP